MTDETALFNSHALFAVLSMHRSRVPKIDTINVKAQGPQTKTSYKGLIYTITACMHYTHRLLLLSESHSHVYVP